MNYQSIRNKGEMEEMAEGTRLSVLYYIWWKKHVFRPSDSRYNISPKIYTYTFFIHITYVWPHIGIFISQSVSRGHLKGHRLCRIRVRLMYAEPRRSVIASWLAAILPVENIQYMRPIILFHPSEAEKQPYYPPLMKPDRSISVQCCFQIVNTLSIESPILYFTDFADWWCQMKFFSAVLD